LDIYVKPAEKAELFAAESVWVRDVAEVVAPAEIAAQIRGIKLMDITAARKTNYLIRVTDIIRAIQKKYPSAALHNVGAQDTVVQNSPERKKKNKAALFLKTAFVALILLVGSATAIMSFHTDTQIPKVFENYYKIFYGEEKSNPLIITIPYSIGLAAGIIVFYNHLLGKKLTNDPTPIEVEMTQYETEVNETLIEALKTSKDKQSD
jgi:stage V sporulation protein AA